MEYEEFLEHYVPEIQLIEALDRLNQYSEDAAEILDRLVSGSKDEKSDAESVHLDPSQKT